MNERPATNGPPEETTTRRSSPSVPDTGVTTEDWPRCDFAGIFCGALGWHQREAAGRARLCCRSYLFGFGNEGER